MNKNIPMDLTNRTPETLNTFITKEVNQSQTNENIVKCQNLYNLMPTKKLAYINASPKFQSFYANLSKSQ